MQVLLDNQNIEISDEQIVYYKLKIAIENEARNAQKIFLDRYDISITSVSSFMEEIEEYCFDIIEESFDNLSQMFIDLGVYDYSSKFIISQIKSFKFLNYLNNNIFSEIVKNIEEYENELDYREHRKNNRNRVGHDYTISGSIKSGLFNSLTDVAHSAFNSFENSLSEDKLNSELSNLCFSIDTQNNIANEIYLDINDAINILIDILLKNNIITDDFNPTNKNTDRNLRIFENIKADKIPRLEQKKFLLEFLKKIPYEITLYTEHTRKFDFNEIKEYFNFSDEEKESILNEYFSDEVSNEQYIMQVVQELKNDNNPENIEYQENKKTLVIRAI